MTTFNPEQIAALSAKLDPKHVLQRAQSGRQLSYIEGWHAIAEANRIFGFDGWHRETVELREVRPAELVKNTKGYETWRVGFMARVRVTVGLMHSGIIREGTGFGSGAMGDLGEAMESAIKEAETDAMKRAMMTFGNPFGLALYDKTQANVGVDAPRTSNSLRKDGAWESLKAELENDFIDVHSIPSLVKLKNEYRDKARAAGWPKAWLESLAEEFDRQEEAIRKVEIIGAG